MNRERVGPTWPTAARNGPREGGRSRASRPSHHSTNRYLQRAGAGASRASRCEARSRIQEERAAARGGRAGKAWEGGGPGRRLAAQHLFPTFKDQIEL